jgi:hypothetical protein
MDCAQQNLQPDNEIVRQTFTFTLSFSDWNSEQSNKNGNCLQP